jgi:acetate kinase
MRHRICEGLDFPAVELKPMGTKNAPLISADARRVKCGLFRTNEHLMIAGSVTRVLNLG